MQQTVGDAIQEMERRFERLAGQALREPNIDIFYDGEMQTGKTVNLKLGADFLELGSISIKNSGDRRADMISVKLLLSVTSGGYLDIWTKEMQGYRSGDWDNKSEPVYKDYPTVVVPDFAIPPLSPQETYSINPLRIRRGGLGIQQGEGIKGKFEVYYGAEKPSVVFFNFVPS